MTYKVFTPAFDRMTKMLAGKLVPISGAELHVYLWDTYTRAALYQTSAGTTQTNPVVADSGGVFPAFYRDPAIRMRAIYTGPGGDPTDQGDVLKEIEDIDEVPAAVGLARDLSNFNGDANDMALFLQAGEANANDIAYTAPNGVAQTVESRLRLEILVTDYGADPSGVNNSTDAFVEAAALIQSNGGGRLVVPPGLYKWGKQNANTGGWRWQGTDLISITGCERPVSIICDGVIFRTEAGLKFGRVNATTGNVDLTVSSNFNTPASGAYIGAVFNLVDNASVSIMGAPELDGNADNLDIGGSYGDVGRQLPHDGVVAYGNGQFYADRVYAHDFGRDGFIVAWPGLAATDPIYPHTLFQCRSLYNYRQAFSWVGGNNLHLIGGDYSHTGKGTAFSAVTPSLPYSPPAAGLDIETEGGAFACTGLRSRGVQYHDNTGVAVLADIGVSSDNHFNGDTIIGTTSWSLWINSKPGYVFEDCKVVGAVAHIGGTASSPTTVRGGRWSMDPDDSPTGSIYDTFEPRMVLDQADAIYDHVHFVAGGANQLPFMAGGNMHNCRFEQEATAQFYVVGNFTGRNIITAPTSTAWDPSSVLNYGYLSYAFGAVTTYVPQESPYLKSYYMLTNDSVNIRFIKTFSFYDATGMAGSLGDVNKLPASAAAGKAEQYCITSGIAGVAVWKDADPINA